MNTITDERIEAGIAWLDENEPGWRDKVRLDTLDMASAHCCVLGQVYADDDRRRRDRESGYLAAMRINNKPYSDEAEEWSVEHGFNVADPDAEPMELTTEGWQRWVRCRAKPLTDAWLERLSR